jgi:hypothetical protein
MPQAGQMPGGAHGMGGPRTSQVCVTQEMIDKFGGPYSNPPRADCQVSNVSVKDTGMTATVACTGQFTGNGDVATTFVDQNTVQTQVHVSGTMQMGPNSRPIDVTMQSKATYKGPDCGSVKPLAMPASK